MPNQPRYDRAIPNCYHCGEKLKYVSQTMAVPCEDCLELDREVA
jgi:hypothetical protein